MFLDLGVVAACRRHPLCPVPPGGALPLVTQAVCSRGSPKRAAWVLLLWQADCVGGWIGLVGRYSGLVPGPACEDAAGCC